MVWGELMLHNTRPPLEHGYPDRGGTDHKGCDSAVDGVVDQWLPARVIRGPTPHPHGNDQDDTGPGVVHVAHLFRTAGPVLTG